jgi:hypothetical protein
MLHLAAARDTDIAGRADRHLALRAWVSAWGATPEIYLSVL